MSRTSVSRADLAPLIDRAWSQLEIAKRLEACVEPSIPILFFGDLSAYESSALRIVTVALNPSSAEFPIPDRFKRFPRARDIRADEYDRYLSALSEYFGSKQYGWFGHFEQFLKHLGAAYTSAPADGPTALHTDLLTPVATGSGWNGVAEDLKPKLSDPGVELWHDLLNVLKPHLVVTSVGREHRERIHLPIADSRDPIALPHRSSARWHVIDGDLALVVHGHARAWPLPLNSHEKQELALAVKELLHQRDLMAR